MKRSFHYKQHLKQMLPLLQEIEANVGQLEKELMKIVKRHPQENGRLFSKTQLIMAYQQLAGTKGLLPHNQAITKHLQMKPIRTMSGVAPITVLTKPFPCPGKCIFCPSDVRMPKSYLSNEPGAQRAERNYFDPYLQTYNRLQALSDMGHEVDKAELIVLGGTWSYYPENYQIWFVKECFRAMNDFGRQDKRDIVWAEYENRVKELEDENQAALTNDPAINEKRFQDQQPQGNKLEKTYNQLISDLYVAPEKKLGLDQYQQASWKELDKQHKINETAQIRCVGLVLETRPDNISQQEVIRLRKLGCTKVQMGVQSLNDEVLAKNHRGHDVAATARAFKLLRQAGFKIHAHWMANLYGSNVDLDKQDYQKLFTDPNFKPDELKIYPCSLISSAELMSYYKRGLWRPYSHDELLEVVVFCLQNTPQYCRLSRVMRDIPSPDIVVGNKKSNFRQIAQQELVRVGQQSQNIRAREIRQQKFIQDKITLDQITYQTSDSQEIFLQFLAPTESINKTTEEKKLLAFLRLSFPFTKSYIPELGKSAIIREIHVYGQAVGLGKKGRGQAQHSGLGTRLIAKAKKIASQHKYKKLAVISAIGTKEYYRKRGFKDGELYQIIDLND